jgi:NitT/TauT family transport system substrate-binding protein
MKKNARVSLVSVLLLLVIMLLVATNGSANEKIVYRLKWLRNVSVVGALYAESKGLFAKAGLDVEVKEGGPERDAIRELELGHADFGAASADQVLRARAKGSPVVVIAQLFQVNPLQWMYRPEEVKIKALADLKGKNIGITFGGNDEAIMRTMLAEAGLAESEVKLFSVRYDYTPFYRHQVQLWPVYRNAQGPIIAAQLQKAGEQTAFMNPVDFGVKFVANSVVTNLRTIKEKPELVQKFKNALLEGWTCALNPSNEEETIQILHKYDGDTPIPILHEQLKITRSLIQPDPAMAIGSIDEAGWQQTQHIMHAQKLIPEEVDLKEVLQPVATR